MIWKNWLIIEKHFINGNKSKIIFMMNFTNLSTLLCMKKSYIVFWENYWKILYWNTISPTYIIVSFIKFPKIMLIITFYLEEMFFKSYIFDI